MYKPIPIDREKLTLMGVPFPDLATLDSTANAIGSNMYEGFEPTASNIILIRDYVTNKITFSQLSKAAKEANGSWNPIACMRKTLIEYRCIICDKAQKTSQRRHRQTCSTKCWKELVRRNAKLQDRSCSRVWHTLTCVICGKKYTLSGRQLAGRKSRKTCSIDCKYKLFTTEKFLENMVATIRRNPKTGHFPTHCTAKEYSLKSPEGEIFNGKNLIFFVTSHPKLFADMRGLRTGMPMPPKSIAAFLRNLAPRRGKNRRASWCGWRWNCNNRKQKLSPPHHTHPHFHRPRKT